MNALKFGDLEIPALCFADDYFGLSTKVEGLQTSADALSDFCRKHQLTINISKSAVVPLHMPPGSPHIEPILIDGKPLPVKSAVTYLGLHLPEDRTEMQSGMIKKAFRSSMAL